MPRSRRHKAARLKANGFGAVNEMATSKPTLAKDAETTVSCSFCSKDQTKVRKVIAGPTSNICDECIELCNEILKGEREDQLLKGPDTPEVMPPEPGELIQCRVCGIYALGPDALRVQRRWPVCPTCIESVLALSVGAHDRESTDAWLAQSEDDLDTAEKMLSDGKLHLVYFFSHEAIEKVLCAFLIANRRGTRDTHSIFTLVKRAKELDSRFDKIGTDAWTLDTLYVFSRYPFGTPFKAPCEFFIDTADAQEAVSVARDVIALVRESLGK